MASSSIPTLKKQLALALQGRSKLAQVQVSYGAAYPIPEPEWIWLADVDGDQVPGAIGQQRREETYELTIIIRVVRSTVDDQAAATDRAFELMAEIEAQLRTDASVGGAVRIAQVRGRIRLVEDANAEQQISTLEITIHCEKRI